jgi:hypothetical protein
MSKVKCRECEWGEVLRISAHDRATKTTTHKPSGWALCSRARRVSEMKHAVKDTRKKCVYFERRNPGGQGE